MCPRVHYIFDCSFGGFYLFYFSNLAYQKVSEMSQWRLISSNRIGRVALSQLTYLRRERFDRQCKHTITQLA